MLGVIYLLLSVLVGKEIAQVFFSFEKREPEKGENRLWLLLPVSFGTGTLVMTWSVYLISWGMSAHAGEHNPLFYGNAAVLTVSAVFLIFRYGRLIFRRNGSGDSCAGAVWIADKRRFCKELLFFYLTAAALLLIMFYVFFIRDGVLYAGYTVYGDYAPHVSMMRSFSRGANYPTQYPHFGGADVKYHFMFQFLTGNLEYLGIRLDWAYNLAGMLSLEGFFMMLYMLAGRIMKNRACGVIAVILFFFRSGAAFFRYLWEHLMAGDLLRTLAENISFIGYTPNEDWGLYNFNVYLNQRHLGFGLLLVSIAVWFYLEWAEAGCAHEEKGLVWLGDRLFSPESWKNRNLSLAILMGILLGLCAFWNGAAVIGGLLILMGFGIFSDGKLDYAVTAALTVILSWSQTRAFISGKAIGFSVYWGFLSENKTPGGVLCFFLEVTGIFFAGLAVVCFFMKRTQRVLMAGFLFPAIFTFFFSLTPDIAVNHKYLMISCAFLGMFWAWAACALWNRRFAGRALTVLLLLCLTLTGIYDFVIIVRNNGGGRRVEVSMESPLTEWLTDHLDSRDLVLTPEYSINEVTVSGLMMYLGWPYYAWSAGYDTYYRAAVAEEIYSAADPERVKELVSQEGITYILYEEGMEFEEHKCREDIIAKCYPLAYESEDGRIRIYET